MSPTRSNDPTNPLNSFSLDNNWPDLDSDKVTLGRFIRPLGCDSDKHGVLFEGAIRVRCTAPRHSIPKGMVLFEYYDPKTGVLLESRLGPYRRP
jgi:hypothetical protein